jgi:kynurenine formamidase
MRKIIDLSHVVSNQSPVYPNDQPVVIETIKRYVDDGYHLSTLTSSMHAGTHIDAPLHLSALPTTMDQFPLDVGIGNGVVIDVRGQDVIELNQNQLELIQKDDIVILYTGWDQYYDSDKYYDHPILTIASAQALIDKQIAMLGMDMPSIEHYPFDIHHLMMNHGVWMIENLTHLDALDKNSFYKIYAIPIKIEAEAALARVFAIELEVEIR